MGGKNGLRIIDEWEGPLDDGVNHIMMHHISGDTINCLVDNLYRWGSTAEVMYENYKGTW